jgi:hypothetical protein
LRLFEAAGQRTGGFLQIGSEASEGQVSPNCYQDFIRISLPVSTTRLFSTWRDIPDS